MKFRIFFLLLSLLGSASAQAFLSKMNSVAGPGSKKIAGTYKILAVMVEFQEDKDAATFGNGRFGSIYTKEYGSSILDPLPHDQEYFNRHLSFAKNYFRKVSGGKVDIEYSVLPGIITLSKAMRNYSPSNSSSDLRELGVMAKEVWQKTAAENSGINFGEYDIFLIFHAGVGRDISLETSLGNDRDLPSVYLSDKTLKNIFANDLAGLPLNRENEYNTMIIPETESREVEGNFGLVLVEISINGLIVASIASHFGLPDLFDTNTGLSAIGRFGLMDGQAIFDYNGCFPPEPSPWEKIFLGWETPLEITPENRRITLTAKQAANLNDTTNINLPIFCAHKYLVLVITNFDS